MDLPLSDEERIELLEFIDKQFKGLTDRTIQEFKDRALFPGKGQVSDYIDYTTLMLYAQSSAKAAYQYYKDYKADVCGPMAKQIMDQAFISLQETLFKHIDACTTPIVGNLINILRFANIEKEAYLIVNKKIAANIKNAKSFEKFETKNKKGSIIYKTGRWKNVYICVNPLLEENDNTAYLIHDVVFDYRIVHLQDIELIKIDDIGTDLKITVSPALLQYKFSPEDTFKVFKIKKLLYE